MPQSELGESPLWPTAAVLSSALLYVTLPGRFILGRQASGQVRLRKNLRVDDATWAVETFPPAARLFA